MRSFRSLSCAFAFMASAASMVQAAEPSKANDDRVVAYLSSADELISDVRHIVVDLAGESKGWNDVLAQIEVWLFGVDQTRPVGVDVLFSGETGKVVEFHVPVTAKRRDFLNDNLGNVNIIAKQDSRNKDLYQLTDVYEGWLLFTRSANGQEYGSIVPNQANLPTASPVAKFEVFKNAGYDAGIRWVATPETKAARDQGFDRLLSEVSSNVKKRPDETAAQFELRRLNLEQGVTRLGKLLSNSAELVAGWKTDVAAKKYHGESRLVGLPGSDVDKNIQAIGTEVSKFATVPTSSNSVMSARVLLPLAESYQKDRTKVYEASLAALKDRFDQKEGASAEEKAARKEFAEKSLQIAIDSLSLGWLDVFAELTPASGSMYNGLVGVRVKDASKVVPVIELLPKTLAAWKVNKDVAEESGVKIHQVDLKGKLPVTFKTYFGDEGQVYVGVNDQVLWIAAGPNGLDQLKAAAKAAAAGGGATSQTAVHVAAHLRPALQIGQSLTNDRDIELFDSLKQGGLLKGGNAANKNEEDGTSERRISSNVLANFKWHDATLEAMAGGKDVIDLKVTRDGNALLGSLNVEEGVMKAVGKLISKFVAEVLQ